MAILAVAGGLAACDKDKDKDPEGPTDFSGGCEAVDLGITTKDGKPLKWASYNVGAQNEKDWGFSSSGARQRRRPNMTGLMRVITD